MIEVPKGVKWHGDCFCCGKDAGQGRKKVLPGCGTCLVGQKYDKEGDQFFCHPCWVDVFAPTCCFCAKNIESGDRKYRNDANGQKEYFHPSCKPAKDGAGGANQPAAVLWRHGDYAVWVLSCLFR